MNMRGFTDKEQKIIDKIIKTHNICGTSKTTSIRYKRMV